MINITISADNLDELSHIANGEKYYSVCKDLSGWLAREARDNEYYDKETLEYAWDKLHEILLSYNVSI